MSSYSNKPTWRYFKLFVKESGQPTLNVLRYLQENIDIINQMGVKIKIQKLKEEDLSKEVVDNLTSKGVLRFPALITDGGKVRHGVEKIQDLFEGNKNSYNKHLLGSQPPSKQSVFSGDFAKDPDLASYFQSEMNLDALARDNRNGEKEGFEGGVTDEFNRRVSEQLSRRQIGTGAPSIDMDGMMARRQETMSTKSRNRVIPKETDNIAMSETSAGVPEFMKKSTKPQVAAPATGGFDDAMFEARFMEGLDDGLV